MSKNNNPIEVTVHTEVNGPFRPKLKDWEKGIQAEFLQTLRELDLGLAANLEDRSPEQPKR